MDRLLLDMHNNPNHHLASSLKFQNNPSAVRSASDSKNQTLFVANLSISCQEKDLTDLFSTCGTVYDTRLMKTRKNAFLGYAFVVMSTEEEAVSAAIALNGKTLLGRELRIGFGACKGEKQGSGHADDDSAAFNELSQRFNTGSSSLDGTRGQQFSNIPMAAARLGFGEHPALSTVRIKPPEHKNSLLLRFSYAAPDPSLEGIPSSTAPVVSPTSATTSRENSDRSNPRCDADGDSVQIQRSFGSKDSDDIDPAAFFDNGYDDASSFGRPSFLSVGSCSGETDTDGAGLTRSQDDVTSIDIPTGPEVLTEDSIRVIFNEICKDFYKLQNLQKEALLQQDDGSDEDREDSTRSYGTDSESGDVNNSVTDVNLRRIFDDGGEKKGYGFVHFQTLELCLYVLQYFRSFRRGGVNYAMFLSKSLENQVGKEKAELLKAAGGANAEAAFMATKKETANNSSSKTSNADSSSTQSRSARSTLADIHRKVKDKTGVAGSSAYGLPMPVVTMPTDQVSPRGTMATVVQNFQIQPQGNHTYRQGGKAYGNAVWQSQMHKYGQQPAMPQHFATQAQPQTHVHVQHVGSKAPYSNAHSAMGGRQQQQQFYHGGLIQPQLGQGQGQGQGRGQQVTPYGTPVNSQTAQMQQQQYQQQQVAQLRQSHSHGHAQQAAQLDMPQSQGASKPASDYQQLLLMQKQQQEQLRLMQQQQLLQWNLAQQQQQQQQQQQVQRNASASASQGAPRVTSEIYHMGLQRQPSASHSMPTPPTMQQGISPPQVPRQQSQNHHQQFNYSQQQVPVNAFSMLNVNANTNTNASLSELGHSSCAQSAGAQRSGASNMAQQYSPTHSMAQKTSPLAVPAAPLATSNFGFANLGNIASLVDSEVRKSYGTYSAAANGGGGSNPVSPRGSANSPQGQSSSIPFPSALSGLTGTGSSISAAPPAAPSAAEVSFTPSHPYDAPDAALNYIRQMQLQKEQQLQQEQQQQQTPSVGFFGSF